MPISNPAQASVFNADYDIVGEYVTDDSRVPYYNPADSGVMIQPGEPVLLKWGAANNEQVFMAQGPIRPGEIGFLARFFTGDFPCDFSANVIMGAEVMWDITNKKVSLAADVTNGFILGEISYAIPSTPKPHRPPVDANDRVICATTASTKCRVISSTGVVAVNKGTVVILGEVDEDE
jgi:hypothetical protein